MASLRTQNALLFVIAVCLVLLVVHFYSGHLVAKAYAAGGGGTVIYGCIGQPRGVEPCEKTRAVQVDESGRLLTATK